MFPEGRIVIEAERFVSRRGMVKRVRRDAKYDPAKMAFLTPGVEAPVDLLSADFLDLEPVQPVADAHRRTLEYFFYKTEGRQFLTYQPSDRSSSSSLYPPADLVQSVVKNTETTESRADRPASFAAAPVKVSVTTSPSSKP
jgi:hypothetical protein